MLCKMATGQRLAARLHLSKGPHFRMRVTSIPPLGDNWRRADLDSASIQIDSGSSGVIYAVSRCGFVLSISSFLSHSSFLYAL